MSVVGQDKKRAIIKGGKKKRQTRTLSDDQYPWSVPTRTKMYFEKKMVA